jgi:putative DNA primase/helicase
MTKPAFTAKGLHSGVLKEIKPTPHEDILDRLLQKVPKVNFREAAGFEKKKNLTKKHYLIIAIDKMLELAEQNRWGLCKKNGFIHLYNSAYWRPLGKEKITWFLGKVAGKMGVDRFDAKYFRYKDDLFK